MIALGAIVAKPSAWFDFVTAERASRATPVTNNVGLSALLSHDFGGPGRMEMATDSNAQDPFQRWKQMRIDHLASNAVLYWVIAGLCVVLLVLAWRRTSLLWVGGGLGATLVVVLQNLTCMSYSLLVVWAPLSRKRPWLHMGLPLFAVTTQLVALREPFNDDRFAMLSLATLVFSAVGTLFSLGWRKPRRARPAPLAEAR